MRPDAAAIFRRGWAFFTTGFLGRVVRYGIAGVAVASLYSLAVLLLVPLIRPMVPTVASVMAFFLVLPVGYWLHRGWSFADRAGGDGQAWRFAVTNVSSFIVSVGGMYVITEVIRISYLFGIAWNWVAVPAINFGIYLLWVFRHPTPASGGHETHSGR